MSFVSRFESLLLNTNTVARGTYVLYDSFLLGHAVNVLLVPLCLWEARCTLYSVRIVPVRRFYVASTGGWKFSLPGGDRQKCLHQCSFSPPEMRFFSTDYSKLLQ